MIEIEKSGPPYLYRYRANNDNTIDELRRNYIYFSDRKELNDPYDSIPSLIDVSNDPKELEKTFKLLLEQIVDLKSKAFFAKNYSKENISELIKKNIEPFLNQFGIACFSINALNLLLWANYSNNSKGICLQYNMDFDKNFFKGWRPITYVRDLKKIIYRISPNGDNMMDIFYNKLELWQKEYEVRLVKERKGKIEFKKECLRSVVLGYNIESNFKKNIIKTIKENYNEVNIYQMKKPTDLMKISFSLV